MRRISKQSRIDRMVRLAVHDDVPDIFGHKSLKQPVDVGLGDLD